MACGAILLYWFLAKHDLNIVVSAFDTDDGKMFIHRLQSIYMNIILCV